jgi:glycerol-3-phosphate dehydrogenase
MPSETPAAASDRYDLLVIGGGIHGLFAAYDAAQRGLSVALVERADFGSGLTFNHQRTIHGGLRALGTGRVFKTRRQIAERRTWARIAPHLLRPLPFLVGTYGWTTKSRWAVRAGFTVYDLVGRSRNREVSPELHLPKSRLESAAATKRLFPGIAEAGLSGGAIWYDYQTRHPDRLTWAVALAARAAGARLVNWTEATEPLRSGGVVCGARVRDLATNREYDVEAKVTLLAAGAALPALGPAFDLTDTPPLLRAMNVLLDRPARDIATAAPASSGRMLTAVPWRGYVLVGTHQSDGPVAPGETEPPAEALDAFIGDLNTAFARFHATRADIRLVHHGLTPAVVVGSRATLLAEPQITRPATTNGVISIVGVKYTTARAAAEHAVDAVCAEIGGHRRPSRTATSTLPHAGIADVEGRLVETLRDLGVELDRDVIDHLTGWYGTEASDVVRTAADANELERLSEGSPVLAGEISYAARFADAKRLSDAVLRRTPLGSAGHPGRPALERAADVMGKVHHWTAERRENEIRAVEERYP